MPAVRKSPLSKSDMLLAGVGMVALGALVYAARLEGRVAQLEARVAVAEHALDAPAAAAATRGAKAGKGSKRGTRSKSKKQKRRRTGVGQGGVAASAEPAVDAERAAELEAAAAAKHADMLDAVDAFLEEADIPEADEEAVRALYEDTFEAAADIRASVREGARTRPQARKAHHALRQEARAQLEELLEPEELDALQAKVREHGGGGL